MRSKSPKGGVFRAFLGQENLPEEFPQKRCRYFFRRSKIWMLKNESISASFFDAILLCE
nr:MAG TPA: hypothetical protein [Bacteriophage sp.]